MNRMKLPGSYSDCILYVIIRFKLKWTSVSIHSIITVTFVTYPCWYINLIFNNHFNFKLFTYYIILYLILYTKHYILYNITASTDPSIFNVQKTLIEAW